jgi:alkylresorcinol/alkylpyrone synthase
LGEQVVCALLDQVNLDPEEIDLIAFTSITGIAVPSIDARLMNLIAFSPYLKRMPLFGLGCMGGAAGIARLADYLVGHPDEAAILLSIELCSLTIQRQDLSVENMISSGLFGDGAAAVLMTGSQHPLAQPGYPRVVDTRSVFFPKTEHIMGWDIQDSGFKVLLSSDVSSVVESNLKPALTGFLASQGLSIGDITHWLVHPGGPKVIQAVETGLGLTGNDLELSREVLAFAGNISSASVLMVLEKLISQHRTVEGDYGLLMAMGPAFNAELVLLQW